MQLVWGDPVHTQGPGTHALDSNGAHLRRRIIYLDYCHHYDAVAPLDPAKELAKATKPTLLRDLFSRRSVEQAESERRN